MTEEVKKFDLTQFRHTPLSLKAALDQVVVGQEAAKRCVAQVMCTHYRRLRHDRQKGLELLPKEPKSNLMLIGNTGCGKTLLIETAANIMGVPFAVQDASTLTESGYVGDDINDVFRSLLGAAGKDSELAEMGIVYFDEIDKLATPPGYGRDIGGKSVQQELLRVMEGTNVRLYARREDDQALNTKNMLFVMSGAFDGLQDIVRQRVGKGKLGFSAGEETPPSFLPIEEDLVRYGFDRQFLGRVPNVLILENLTEAHLRQILHLPRYAGTAGRKRDFAAYGIELQFTEQGLNALAQKAASYAGMGGRALKRVLDDTLSDFAYHLPSTDLRYLEVNEALVRNPQEVLDKILRDHPLQEEPHEDRVERIRHTYSETTYLARLRDLNVSPALMDKAKKYGMKYGHDPSEIPGIISGFEQEITAYEQELFQRLNLRLKFQPDAREEVLKEKLSMGSRDISAILDRFTERFGIPDCVPYLSTTYIQIGLNEFKDPSDLLREITLRRD
jgi:endopeptidase Clp ATP-binding regulatory subunit ClpX